MKRIRKTLFIMLVFVLIVGAIFMFSSCSSTPPKQFSIVYHTNCEGVSIDTITFDEAALKALELAIPQRTGYAFDGWFFDSDYNEMFDLSDIKEGLNELYAKWSVNEYSITVHNGDDVEYKFDFNDPIRLNEVTKDGFTFAGYYTNEELTNFFDSVNMPANNIDLYPKFIKDAYYCTINYAVDAQKGYLIGLPTQCVAGNSETSEVEVKALDGFRFVGWSDDLATAKRKDVVTEDATYVAQFERVYTLTLLNSMPYGGNLEGESVQVLVEGEISSKVKAVPNLGYKFKSWSNDSVKDTIQLTITEDTIIYANFAIDYLELPVMEIITDNRDPIVSKDDYLKCKVSVSNAEYKYIFDSISAKIKGRGNSTWQAPKKPYKLKFDKKIDLFGNGEAKTWTLLANYYDPSMIRNGLAYALGGLVNADYTTTTQFVDLYVNGEYAGVYLICEQNEVGKTRVNIDESFEYVNTGYLLELDQYAPDEGALNRDYFVLNGKNYVIKSPDTEDELFTTDYINYIKEYLSNAYDAIVANDDTLINALVDLDSFARTYIVHEVVKMKDVGWSSFYLYKDKDGLLKSGPLWDFDLSSGNIDDVYNIEVTTLIAKKDNPWYKKLCAVPGFVDRVSALLKENYILIVDQINSYCDDIVALSNSINRNFSKWQTLGEPIYPKASQIVAINTWEEQVEYLRKFLLKSLDYVYNYYVDCDADAFSIVFNIDENANILVYNTDDYNSGVIVLDQAWCRDLTTGELSNDGTASIAFKVCLTEGYAIDKITIDNPSLCGLVCLIDEENRIYRIDNITGNIEIFIIIKDANASEFEEPGYAITFNVDAHATIMVYASNDYSLDGTIANTWALSDISGDGQVNFKVILSEGYIVDQISVVGAYKNIKDPSSTGTENVYRITKVASDLTINIITKLP